MARTRAALRRLIERQEDTLAVASAGLSRAFTRWQKARKTLARLRRDLRRLDEQRRQRRDADADDASNFVDLGALAREDDISNGIEHDGEPNIEANA